MEGRTGFTCYCTCGFVSDDDAAINAHYDDYGLLPTHVLIGVRDGKPDNPEVHDHHCPHCRRNWEDDNPACAHPDELLCDDCERRQVELMRWKAQRARLN